MIPFLNLQLTGNLDRREQALKRCAGVLSEHVAQLRKVKDERPSDLAVIKSLGKQQTNVSASNSCAMVFTPHF
jgi:hypothetical protein